MRSKQIHMESFCSLGPKCRNHLESRPVGIFFCSTMHLDLVNLRCCGWSRLWDTDKAITS